MSEHFATLARPRRTTVATKAPEGQRENQRGSLLSLIRRIQSAVDEETHGIRTDVRFDVAASNARKSRYLYDLNRAARTAAQAGLSDDHKTALTDLRQSLERNEQAILAHLGAVREVSELIQSAIRRSETDGTYSASEFART